MESENTKHTNIELEKIVDEILKAYNMESFYEFPANIQKYLSNIEEYFQNCEKTYQEAKKLLDDISLSYRGISKFSGVAWSTLNRYSILKEYIDIRIKSLECNVDLVSSNKLSSITNNYNQLKKEIDYMVDNCLTIGILNEKIKALEEENRALLNENNRLKLEHSLLSKNVKTQKNTLITDFNQYK